MELSNTLTALLVKPGCNPTPVTIPIPRESAGKLHALQKVVGDPIEITSPFRDPVCLISNEEAKLIGLPPNRLLFNDDGVPYDFICGTLLVVGYRPGDSELSSLPPELMQKYGAYYRQPKTHWTPEAQQLITELFPPFWFVPGTR